MAGDDLALVKGNRRERREKERKSKAVDNTFRRTWDKEEFEAKAAERDKVCTRTPTHV
jgi:hypothetical protein